MNKVSSATLDTIRVVAMSGILLDHFLQSTGVAYLTNTGLFLGGVNFSIFVWS